MRPPTGCSVAGTALPAWFSYGKIEGGRSRRTQRHSFGDATALSISAILTRSGNESAFIFCIILPRCAFTVISLMLRWPATCFIQESADHQLHYLLLASAKCGITLLELPQPGFLPKRNPAAF